MSSESLFPNVPSQWEVTTLGELAKASGGDIQTGPFGSQLHAGDYVDDGIPSIMPKNISVDAVTTDDIARVSTEDVERLSKYKVEVGDIVYSRRGDIEKCARITEKEDGWLCGTGCLRVRVKSQSVSTEYLHAYLCHPTVREWIVRHAVGATMPNLNTSILSALPVVIPSDEEMAIIASIWLTISDKIQLNHQINQTLEQMAQAIFKSWFVDFEPVKAKIAALEAGGSEEDALLAAMQAISGKGEAELTRLQAEQPEQYAELRATAELFPSAMQDSELGEIPEGWEVTDLKSSTIEIRRGISPKYTEEGGIQVINQKCIRNHKVDFSLARRNDTSKRKIDGREIQIGDVLVNSTGVGTLGRLAPVRHLPEPSVADSHITVIRANNRLISNAFLAGLMITSEPLIEASGAGSTGQTELRKQVLEEIVFARPSLKLSRAYEGAVEPMGQQMACIERQLVSLASTRDVILPKLLSGDLSVPNKGNQPKAEPLSPLQGVE